MENNLWSIEKVWNEAITQKQKPTKERDYIYPGDIGKNFYERYLKMTGVEPDKTYDDRVLRKFSAGLWFEDQIGNVFKTIGILKESQEDVEIAKTDDHLRISGRLDFVAGGITNWADAEERVKSAKFPEFVETTSLALISHFKSLYPKGLEEVVVEVKSVNSQVFWAKKDYLDEAYPHHVMQLYTYLKAKGIKKGILLYVSKDDLTVKEQVILLEDKELEERWLNDVRTMSKYYRDKQLPPKPDDIVFDKRKKLTFQHNKMKCVIQGCWVINWEILWSNYFNKITNCKSEEEYNSKVFPMLTEKNNILKEDFKKSL